MQGKTNIAIYGYMPFEHEERISEEEIIRKNMFSNNIGNQLFFNAVVKSLRSRNTSLHHYNPSNFDYIDKCVVPFANNIRTGGYDEYIKVFDDLKKTDIPFVVVGVGTDSNANFEVILDDSIKKIVKSFYSEVLNRTATIGVRGAQTKKVLVEECEIAGDRIDVIGCPSVRYFGKNIKKINVVEKYSKQMKVGINFTAYHYDNDEAIFLYKILKDYSNSFVIFTDKVEAELLREGKDITDINRIHDLLPTKKNHFIIRENRARFFSYQSDLMRCLKTFDFMIGSRIHMTIAAILSGIPAILIAHSTRVKEIAEYHHIPFILRKDINEKTSLEALYYKTIISMNDFYDNYESGLIDYIDFLVKNGLEVSEDFLK